MKRSLFAAFAVLLPLLGVVPELRADAAEPPRGTLVIIGGALRPDTAEVWQRIVTLAGGTGARIAIIPAAADEPQRSGASAAAQLKRFGAAPFVVPLAPALPGRPVREVAADRLIAAEVATAGGVYFTGGEQSRIVEALVEPDCQRSAVLQAIWSVYQRGGVLAGSSAGAAIMSSTMFYQPDDTLSVLQTGANAPRVLAPGLGFIGDNVFVDQHFLARGRFGRMLPAMQSTGYRLGLGIDENTAIVVSQQNAVEVLGESGVILMDLRNARGEKAVQGVRLSYLERGDRMSIATGVVTPSAAKSGAHRIDPASADYAPYFQDQQYYPDVLGFNVLKTLLTQLIDSRQPEVIGLAFGMPGRPNAERGFEFRFRKAAGSLGYFIGDGPANRYTVLNIEMDMTPIKMRQPLYEVK